MHYAPVVRPVQLTPHSASGLMPGDPETASRSALSALLSVLGAGATNVAPGTAAAAGGPVLDARPGPVKTRVIRNSRCEGSDISVLRGPQNGCLIFWWEGQTRDHALGVRTARCGVLHVLGNSTTASFGGLPVSKNNTSITNTDTRTGGDEPHRRRVIQMASVMS